MTENLYTACNHRRAVSGRVSETVSAAIDSIRSFMLPWRCHRWHWREQTSGLRRRSPANPVDIQLRDTRSPVVARGKPLFAIADHELTHPIVPTYRSHSIYDQQHANQLERSNPRLLRYIWRATIAWTECCSIINSVSNKCLVLGIFVAGPVA